LQEFSEVAVFDPVSKIAAKNKDECGLCQGTGCPFCSGTAVCQHNTLATKAPQVAL